MISSRDVRNTLPGAIGLFRDIDSRITLAFLNDHPQAVRILARAWLHVIRGC